MSFDWRVFGRERVFLFLIGRGIKFVGVDWWKGRVWGTAFGFMCFLVYRKFSLIGI